MRSRAAREDAHARILPVFRDVVIRFELLLLTAQLRGRPGAEVVGECQKDFRPERLEQGAPGFTRQRRPQRTDALGGHDRDAFGLARQGKDFSSPLGSFSPTVAKAVFVTEEEHFTPMPVGLPLDPGNPIQHRPLKILL